MKANRYIVSSYSKMLFGPIAWKVEVQEPVEKDGIYQEGYRTFHTVKGYTTKKQANCAAKRMKESGFYERGR